MERLQIQLFGGRGRRSGLGVGGPGIGIATNIATTNMQGKLPEYNGYPDFPDPDYSKFQLNTKEKFIKDTFSLVNYKRAEHEKIGKKYLESLNLNKGITYSTANDSSAFGYVQTTKINGKTYVLKYNLNKADTRRMEYKVKTMIHEGYHACNDGLPWIYNKNISQDKARFHEETRTEMTALFLANKLNGYTYVPSYAVEVVSAAAKYKRLDEYKHCNTLNDLGEVFYKSRMVNKKNPSYYELEEKFRKIKLDDNYYKLYYNRISKNKDRYYEICKNSLFNYEYYNVGYEKIYKNRFDSMITKISGKKQFTLSEPEGQLFVQCVALSMNEEGIL